MRWLLTHHDCRDFAQYERGDWEITSLFVADEFYETLFERGAIRAVNRELYNRYRLASGRGRAAEPATARLLEESELCLN